MIKTVCTVQDCHGNEIAMFLVKNIHFQKHYKLTSVYLNNYVVKDSCYNNYTDWDICDKEKIKNADVLILQVIEKDRGFLNNSEVIKLSKPGCTIIKIPHYRCSIYNYKIIGGFTDKYSIVYHTKLINNIKDIQNVKQSIQTIKEEIEVMNNLPHNLDELEKHKNDSIAEFLKINTLSMIDMSDYFLKNYLSVRLFKARGYPSSIFFYELTNRILKLLDIEQYMPFIDSYFAENTDTPMSDYWHKFCKFTFDNIFYTQGHIEMKEYEFYYMLLYYNNPNILDKDVITTFCSHIRTQL